MESYANAVPVLVCALVFKCHYKMMGKWKSDIFDIMPKPLAIAVGVLYAIGLIEILIGVGYSFYIASDDSSGFNDYKTEILWSYCLGMGSIGLALILMAGSVFIINIERHKQGLSTYSPNKYGKSEGGNFYLNQGVNLLYVGLGVYLLYLMKTLLRI